MGNAKSQRRQALLAQPGRVPGHGKFLEQRSSTVLWQKLNSVLLWEEKSICPRRIDVREALRERPAGTLPSACFLNQLLEQHPQSPLELHKLCQQCTERQCFPWVDLHPQNVYRCISLSDLTPTISHKSPI